MTGAVGRETGRLKWKGDGKLWEGGPPGEEDHLGGPPGEEGLGNHRGRGTTWGGRPLGGTTWGGGLGEPPREEDHLGRREGDHHHLGRRGKDKKSQVFDLKMTCWAALLARQAIGSGRMAGPPSHQAALLTHSTHTAPTNTVIH